MTPEVGPWSVDKHHFLRRYIDGFMTAMKKKPWKGFHYIDLFAGAGIERIKGNGLDWGSPLIAAQSPEPFTQLHLCDIDRSKIAALTLRLKRFPQPQAPQIICGDSNVSVDEITRAIPLGTLSLAFLDPYGLHLNFKTLAKLASRRVDLIIFFPDHLDALRNWENVYQGKPDSNLDRVLGGAPWLETMLKRPREHWPEVLRKLYVERIRTLGYEHFDYERIQSREGRDLYQLIFCSCSSAGVAIWRGIAKNKPGGQSSFDF
jgi:three-Cys-motif partner protein